MVFEQTLELSVQFLVINNTVYEVPLSHPLDMQDYESNGKWMLGQHSLGDRFGRSNDFAGAAEGLEEVLAKAFEEVDVLGLFACKFQEGTHASIVSVKRGPRVIEHERQDELFDKTEDVQVVVASDLIENASLLRGKEGERLHASQGFRQKRLAEVL